MLSVGTVVCESPFGAHTPCSLQTKMRCTLIYPSLSSYGSQLKKEEEEEEGQWFMNCFAVIMSYLHRSGATVMTHISSEVPSQSVGNRGDERISSLRGLRRAVR